MTNQTTMTQSDALAIQVGGSHYKKLAMQPVVFATANHLDPCAFSILKYVTRWRDKNGLQDLEKAIHFAQLRMTADVEMYLTLRLQPIAPFGYTIPYYTYCRLNGIPEAETEVLRQLEFWIHSPTGDYTHGNEAIRLLQQLISENGG